MRRDGLCLVRNVPVEDGQVCKVASRIGGVMPTIYGLQWDVRCVHMLTCPYVRMLIRPYVGMVV